MKNRLVVTATGRASAPPDRVSLTLGASLVRPDPSAGLGEIADKLNRVIETLSRLGVARQSIQTSDLSLWTETDRHGAPAGYRVRNSIHVDLDDVAKVGEVLAATLDTIGEGAEMNGIGFSLKEPEAIAAEARTRAFAAARAKAEQLATLAGRGLGPVVGIDEAVGGPVRPLAKMAMAEAMPVEAGTTDVTVTLRVQFALVG